MSEIIDLTKSEKRVYLIEDGVYNLTEELPSSSNDKDTEEEDMEMEEDVEEKIDMRCLQNRLGIQLDNNLPYKVVKQLHIMNTAMVDQVFNHKIKAILAKEARLKNKLMEKKRQEQLMLERIGQRKKHIMSNSHASQFYKNKDIILEVARKDKLQRRKRNREQRQYNALVELTSKQVLTFLYEKGTYSHDTLLHVFSYLGFME